MDTRQIWNPAVALRRMGADAELLASMVDFFLEDSPLLLKELTQRIAARDSGEACRFAHSLKGLCANFEADAAIRAGAAVETACIAERFDEATALISPLTDQLHHLSLAITAWKESWLMSACKVKSIPR